MGFSFGRYIFGSFRSDTLIGNGRDNLVFGAFGDDWIDARAGNDKVFGGFGDDTIRGGRGDDDLNGGPGLDTALFGGSVSDYDITVRGRFGQRVIVDGEDGRDHLTWIEALHFAGDDATIYVHGRNNAPIARNDTLSAPENGITDFGAGALLGNDSDFDGDALTLASVTGPYASLFGGGVRFDPGTDFDTLAAGETATASFDYTVTDTSGAQDTATATVTITGENDAPVLSASDATVEENTTDVDAAVSATDAEDDDLTFSISGADAAAFAIDMQSGALSFVTAPDFEMPADADADNVYDLTVTVDDGNGGAASTDIAVTVADVAELPPLDARLNEFHYDNAGSDTGEFVEVRVAAGTDPARLSLEAYNGNGGTLYDTFALPAAPAGTDGTYDYYVVETPGLQNGSPDAIALVGDGTIVEFLSYEGTLTAADGTAAGLTSTDIGVEESASTPAGQSLQRDTGDTWRGPEAETRGFDNDFVPTGARLNEFHYDNAGSDTGEFVEVRVNAGADASTLSVALYNGNGGTVYDTLTLPAAPSSSDGTFDYYVVAATGLQNGSPDGIALAEDGALVEFLSYEGSFTANDGPAAGQTSTDVGVEETGATPAGQSLQRDAGDTWRGPEAETRGTFNGPDPQPFEGRINEFHYDNAGTDTGEFVEVRVARGTDVSGSEITLYNGNGGSAYGTVALSDMPAGSDALYDYYVVETPGLQNGGPDGLALSDNGALIEFLSYEGTFTAAGGVANGVTSTDVAVAETGSTPAGQSLQREAGDTWRGPEAETRGGANDGTAAAPVINEARISSSGSSDDTSNFVELFGAPGQSFDGLTLLAVSGEFEPGQVDYAVSLDGAVADENGFLLIGEAGNPALEAGDVGVSSFDLFGSPQSLLVVDGFTGAEGDDLDTDNDGTFDTSVGNVVAGLSLIDGNGTPDVSYAAEVFGPDGSFTPAGVARATDGTGDFVQLDFADTAADTPGESNEADAPPPGPDATIASIQGSGEVAARFGEQVTVEAVVTQIAYNGFFLQEEDEDADTDPLTSEGIFVFTGAGGTAPDVGDILSVSGTVDEFDGETQIDSVSNVTKTGEAAVLPTPAMIALSPDTAQNLEAYEGMRVTVSSGTIDPLTVITNFNLDIFGEIVVSAGLQYQPTQLHQPGSQAAADEAEDNLNNQITISQGPLQSANPDAFPAIPAATGDDGDGILDASDSFTEAGPTFRLGTEITGPITGVLDRGTNTTLPFEQPGFQVIPDAPLEVDQSTNEGARQATPDPVGGTIQVAGFNVLNYFTTLDIAANQGSVGPNNLDPRGATSASDLDRQTAKLVDAALGTGAEVFALQELENGGFADGSAIDAFVDALNAEVASRGGSQSFAFVDPTTDAGFIGTDAITTGLIYDQNAVNLVSSDFLAFEEPSAQTTYDIASVLSDEVGNDIGDFQRSRPAVAATFEDPATSETFTVASVHFKSKGDSGLAALAEAAQDAVDAGNPNITQADVDALLNDPNFDQGDGQGFWNAVRTDGAAELNAWFDAASGASDLYDGTGADNVMVLGDFNAYALEDPTQTFDQDADYVDLIDRFVGQDEAYSFVFDGQRGTLDQAFATETMDQWVTGLSEWHINADEPDLLNYNSEFTNPNFYSDGPFASSDHDPAIVGLDTSLPDLVLG